MWSAIYVWGVRFKAREFLDTDPRLVPLGMSIWGNSLGNDDIGRYATPSDTLITYNDMEVDMNNGNFKRRGITKCF